MIRRTCLLIATISLLAFGACSEDNKVGTGVKVEKGQGATGRLGATTTTVAPVTTAPTATTAATAKPSGPATTAAAAAPTTTAAPKPTTTAAPSATTAPAAQAFEITINGDNSGMRPFDPPQAGVRLGTVVRWVNKSAKVAGVESEEAGFKSPDIPPGGSFEYKTEAKGTFNYVDSYRPYALGVLQVG